TYPPPGHATVASCQGNTGRPLPGPFAVLPTCFGRMVARKPGRINSESMRGHSGMNSVSAASIAPIDIINFIYFGGLPILRTKFNEPLLWRLPQAPFFLPLTLAVSQHLGTLAGRPAEPPIFPIKDPGPCAPPNR